MRRSKSVSHKVRSLISTSVRCAIDERWFRDHSLADPEIALNKWKQRYKTYRTRISTESELRNLLEFTTGLSHPSVDHYRGKAWLTAKRKKKSCTPSWIRVLAFRQILYALGLPHRDGLRKTSKKPKQMVDNVCLFFPLPITSESFYLKCCENISAAAHEHRVSLSIFPTRSDDWERTIKLTVLKHEPDAIILLRLTPSNDLLSFLEQTDVPVVLVHANRRKFKNPVISHIVPKHSKVADDLSMWMNHNKHWFSGSVDPVVLVAMGDENSAEINPESVCLGGYRQERKAAIRDALTKLRVTRIIQETVKDYGIQNALKVWKEHKDTTKALFVCLSDSIAVALGHIMAVQGPSDARSKTWRERVIGFDASSLAENSGIASFDQGLNHIGRRCIETILAYYANLGSSELTQPITPQEDSIYVRLIQNWSRPKRMT